MYHFNTGIFVYNLFRYIQYVNRHTVPSIGDESLKNNLSSDLTRWNLRSRQDLKFYFLFYAFFKLLLDMRCPSSHYQIFVFSGKIRIILWQITFYVQESIIYCISYKKNFTLCVQFKSAHSFCLFFRSDSRYSKIFNGFKFSMSLGFYQQKCKSPKMHC